MHDSLCELFLPWEDLSGCDTRSYDEGTCVSVCSNGQTFIAKSLVDGNNDEPWEGSTSSPKTWEVRSMCYWLSYIGVDCGGMTVSQGDAIATCDNLSELQTLLETAIAKKQDQLKAPDGSDLPGGTCVLTCDEINTAFAVINNAKQDKIKTCAGIDMPPGANVPTCAEMGTAITTAINAIPEPTKPMNCAGVEASQFVACEEFVPLLEEALDNCLTVPSLGD